MEKTSALLFQELSEERFTKRIIHKKDGSTAFILNFMPGQELPPHQHPGTGLYLLVMQGNGTLTVDGETSPIDKEDVIYCDGDETFSFKNTGNDPVSLYVVLNKIPDDRYAQNI